MPTITASSSSDYSLRGPASGLGEEAGNDVLFAALFGAVVSSEEQPDAKEGEKKLPETLLFVGSEEPALADAGVSILPQPLNADDNDDAVFSIDDNVVFEDKKEADAGILAAFEMPVHAHLVNARPLRAAHDRPLTTQLLAKIAEDLTPEHVIVKQKVAMTAAQIAVDGAKMAPRQSDKALPVLISPRQTLRTKLETSGHFISGAPNAELGASSDEMIDALTLKTTSQTGLSLNPSMPQLPSTETSTLLQSGIVSQAGSPAGNQSAGSQAGGSQAGLSSSMAENWLEMLDMQDENWTEQLVKRVERNLANAKGGIDFELNPRSLGKLHINLSLQQNEAQLQMRTETSQAGQMITDAQSRLSAMLENAGIKLSYLGTSTQSNGNGANGQQSGNAHHSRQNSSQNNVSGSDVEQNNDATDVSNSLVNVKA